MRRHHEEIDEAAAKHGLFYPPDPGSLKISTIGGNVAENSGGLRGLKYGVTRDYVMGLEASCSPSGEIVWLGNKCVKDVAGYNLRDLFIGSEGTLGIVTDVLLKLVPQPAERARRCWRRTRRSKRPATRFPTSSRRRSFPARSSSSTSRRFAASRTLPTSACRPKRRPC